LYHKRVGWMVDVSPSFDWKCALVQSELKNQEIEAFCVWNKQRVSIVAPWKYADVIYQDNGSLLIGTTLRSGIVRDIATTRISQGVCLHFVYDKAFELRAIRRTCIRRGEDNPCRNCTLRKRCENQQYAYFLRKLTDSMGVNDCLCMRVKRVIPENGKRK
jgi:hypothetical protein